MVVEGADPLGRISESGGQNRRAPGPLLVTLVALALGSTALFLVWRIQVRAEEEKIRNSMRASLALKAIMSLQFTFRANDLDKNGIHDFWTGDVAGLYHFGSIDRAIAEADARPLTAIVGNPIPYFGYYFVAMDKVGCADSAEEYRQTTDPESGVVHHRSRFAFCAYPAQEERHPSYIWIVSEDQQLWMSRVKYVGKPVLSWPSHEQLRESWTRPE